MNASAQNSKQLKAANANQNIQVYVRLRPMNSRERGIRSQEVVEVPNHREVITRVLLDAKTQKKFHFDRAFGPDSKQHEVYATVVAPLIDEVLAGYNCTVFAYGQTGTGKTHTMVGEESPELSLSWEDDSVIGIIPRALSHLFDELRMTECEFSMRVSYLELYNEELCDLLSTDDTVKIRIFDDSTKKGSVIVQGLEEIPVHSKDDVYKLLAKGQERRRTASTLMNAQSSRSHTVFSILVHIKEVDINGEEMLKIGKLNLVDLAGSENISKAGNERGVRARETVNINQSLLTLGRVITALVERTPHIPYRESKLTRLLQESLGGRTKTSIIATISPGHKDLEETLSTLDYAHRAKNIQNKPEINQRLTKKAVLKEYTEEIDKLKRDLMAARDKNGIFLAQESYDDMMYKIETSNKEINEKHLMVKALKDELASKTKLFNEVSYNLIEREHELQDTKVILANTETDLHHTKKTLTKTKRRYNEKKVILSQHMKTEETLTQQARDLIETCELASADTEGLHENIERRKQVENEITTSCDKFTKKLQENLSNMNSSLADFSEKYCKQSKFIQSEIDNASKTHGTLSKDLGQQLDAINKVISDGFSDRQTLLTFNLKQIDDKTTFNKKEMLALVQEIQGNHVKHLHEVTSLTKNCSQNFEKQQKAWETKQNDFLKAIKEKDVLVKNFTESLKSSMTDFMRESQEKFDAEYKKTTEVVAKQEKELETLQSTFGQFVATMNTMLNQAKTNVADFKSGTAELAANRKQVDEKIQTWTKDLTSHGAAYQTFITKETKINEDLQQQAIEVHETNQTSIAKMQNCTAEHVSDAKCSLTTLDKKVSTAFEDISTLWHSQTREITELDTKVSNNMDEKMTSSKDLVQKCNNCVTAVTANSASLMNCLRKGIQTHEMETKTKLLAVSDDAEHFRRNEIKSYQPTGQTPARKEYRIVRDLAVTSPHNRIIRKFMLDNTASDLDSSIVSEADETLNDSSVMIMESTPMKLDDNITERKDLKELHLSEILSLDAITEENKENQTLVN